MTSDDKIFTDGVEGKIVDRIVLSDDDEEITIEVCFKDYTSFKRVVGPGWDPD